MWSILLFALCPFSFAQDTPAQPASLMVVVDECEQEPSIALHFWERRRARLERRHKRKARRNPDNVEPLVLPATPLELEDPRVGFTVPGVVVSLSGAAERQCATDTSGRCLFSDLPVGVFDIRLEKVGFHPNVYLGLAVAQGQDLQKRICLSYESNDMDIMITQASSLH
jgi:hypothetical protein